MNVLIVEDNADVGWMLSRLIRGLGHTVVNCETPRAAVNSIAAFPADLVLLDIDLPEINGYDLAVLLRRRGLANATILAVSTHADNSMKRCQTTIDGHYVKPLAMHQIELILAGVQCT
jgi:CheY-like chemotaxis protein